MITKDNFLGMLKKSLTGEDEFILRYGKEFLNRVAECETLSDEEKKEIKDLTETILKDTQRHAQVIGKMMKDIKEGPRNEF